MRKIFAAMLVVSLFVSGAFAMTPEEELEAWKKEPAYGKVIKIGYNGGLCTGTLGITQVKGFYKAEGIETELVRYQGDTIALGDALGTGKIDIAGGHIATLLVPAANGVRMKFTTGMHTGCKSLCVLADSPYKTTKDLIGKTIAITTSIGGSDQNITMRFLLRDGIDPVRGVKYKATDSGAAVLAMQNGELEAALLSDQFIQKFLDNGTLRIIRSITFDDDFKDETCCIYAIAKDIV
ncbi:MAG: ABC transporter substrate-binding protein, partial [Synergistaceae bacterium]|nr:ABC transporter substrate-binding protein [Synergistaceae bacterium]